MSNIELFEALRDFFYYGRSEDLKKAYTKLHSLKQVMSNPDDINWEEAEFLFNRLFVGPAAPIAPPVASVYIDPEGAVQGRVTASVREFYNSVGLSLEQAGTRPEDSIEYELDACRYLLHLGESMPEALDAYKDFINEHMSLWVNDFTERALDHCEKESPVAEVLRLLSVHIESESEKTFKSKEIS